MIKKLEIDNFKTLNHFTLELSPMTVIVGNNASGKSIILQIISLLCNSVQEDFDAILSRRNWDVSDLRSKCKPKSEPRLTAAVEFELEVEGKLRSLRWEIILQYIVQKNTLSLYYEEVRDLKDNHVLMEYTEKRTLLRGTGDNQTSYPPLSLRSSALKVVIDGEKEKKTYPELAALKAFLSGMESFELLSPDQMRMSSRGRDRNLSTSGRNLPTFIKNMTEEQSKKFFDKLKRLLGDKIEAVSTETKGKPGWTVVNMEEKYSTIHYKVSSRHLSDGMLRLLAFIGISESEDGRLIMLDEIENGINSSYAEDLIDIFKFMSENGKQLVLTTHSVVFLDFVDKEDIIFLYRDEADGRTVGKRIFEIPELIDKLEYMYPGEIIYNMDNQEIINFCMQGLN